MIGDSLLIDTTLLAVPDKLLYCRALIGELLDLENRQTQTTLTFVDGLEKVAVPTKQRSDLAAYLPQYRAKLKEVIGSL